MTLRFTRVQLLLARVVVGLMAALVLAGVVWNGFSFETLSRLWRNVIERPDGPMLFRFFLQPTMAAIVAYRDGMADARGGARPFFQTVLTDPAQRKARLEEALVATARIILLGLVMDLIYQVIEFRHFFPAEAVAIALLLAFLPYVVLRGVITRVARWWLGTADVRGAG